MMERRGGWVVGAGEEGMAASEKEKQSLKRRKASMRATSVHEAKRERKKKQPSPWGGPIGFLP